MAHHDVAGRLTDLCIRRLADVLGLGTASARQLPGNHTSSGAAWHLDDVPDHAGAGRKFSDVEQAARRRGVCLSGNTDHRAVTELGFLQALLRGLSIGRGWLPPGGGALAWIATGIEAEAHTMDDAIKVRHPRLSFGALRVGDGRPLSGILRLLKTLLIRVRPSEPDAGSALGL